MTERRDLFTAYYPGVEHFFKGQGFSHEDARDLTQETFLRVFQNMDKLRSEAAFGAWVQRIAANVWKNELRRRQAGMRKGREIPLDDAESNVEAVEREILERTDAPDALAGAISAERLAAIGPCLDKLSPRMRNCLFLCEVQDRKYREIADLLKLSMPTVKFTIHEARNRLKDCVARRLAEEES